MPVALSQKEMLGKFSYWLFTNVYQLGIRVVALWNPKAKSWVKGREKFPSFAGNSNRPVWMHCASLGEYEQGRPLLETIRQQYPGKKIILTFFSPSGYEVVTAQENAAAANGKTRIADAIFYLPMDGKINAARFIDAINPCLVLWVKYEFWYYYLAALRQRNIPVLMLCGLFRDGQPFFQWYGSVWRSMLKAFTHFFVQNETSVELLQSVGITSNVSIDGDTRFDRVIEIAERFEPLPLIEAFCKNHQVVVAGSSWEEDEEELVHYVKSNPQLRFIIAPHETDDINIKEVQARFPQAILYSALQVKAVADWPHVLIINNMGMLSKIYYYADVAFIGGGFVEDGIHNVLEAAVYGKPVLHGPAYEKFAEAVDLVELGACIPVNNALEVEDVLNQLLNNEAMLLQKGQAAKDYVYAKAGATTKIMEYIQEKRLLIS